MAHDETYNSSQNWRPSWSADALVVGALLLVCAILIYALSGLPKFAAPTPDQTITPTANSDLPTNFKTLPSPVEAQDALPPQVPELFPLPSSGTMMEPASEQGLRPRLRTPGWGKFAPPPKRGIRGEAFITLLGDREINGATFRSSLPGSEADFINGIWTPKNVSSDVNGLTLWLRKDKNGPRYTMGEMQARGLFGYGRYEVIMRPAKGSGTVSSFFTYSGPHMGVPHDEIDIEFLGADTTKVHFNYFHKGRRGIPTIYDLPFDASEAMHLYAFDWTPEYIAWYVDGVPYEKTPIKEPHIPTYPGKIMFSLWTGTPRVIQWHGKPNFGMETSADYGCISFTPLGETARSCSDIYVPPKQ